MKFAPSCSYERTEQRKLANGTATAWVSRGSEDSCWDKFLQGTPLGQFQQSTIWARAKEAEGWKPLRVVLTMDDDEMVGGFQILWRSSWYGRIGYVSKGPMVLPGYSGLAEFSTELLRVLSRRQGFWGVLVQPPDPCRQMPDRLIRDGFPRDLRGKVISATWVVDLREGFEAVEQGMSKWTRKKMKQAEKRGVTIRQGGREDVRTFFELMLSTCRRQGTEPAPAGCIRLTLAECKGKPLAGLVCILFGKTVSFWKKGWTSSDGDRHPNELLMKEMLQWATSKGYHLADFCALDRNIAIAMLSGEPLTPAQESSRHMFNVRLGGSPWLLPEARVYFPNLLVRLTYRAIFYRRIRQLEENGKLPRKVTESLREDQGQA